MILSDTEAALYSTLQAGTALVALLSGTVSIYNQEAPHGAVLPYVVFNHQAGGPDLITGRDIESNLWAVRAVSSVSAKDAAEIFTEVDALLHKRNISIGSSKTFWCAREENTRMVQEAPNNTKAYHCGGIYRVRTSGG